MPDPFQHVRPGEAIRLSATAHNACLDAARDYQQRRRSAYGEPGDAALPNGVVLIKNDTGDDVAQFGVLGVDGVLYTPEDNEQGFMNGPVLKGIVPTADHMGGRFVILLEPVRDGAVGRALVQGVTPVKVQVEEGAEDYRWADVIVDEAERLGLTQPGAAYVLWREEGTGEKWAVVRLDSRPFIENPPQVHGGKVVGRYNETGGPWADFETDGHVAFVTAHPCFLDGSDVDEEVTLYLKATELPKKARVGFRDIAVGDVLGWIACDQSEPVPGETAPFDGQVVAYPGVDGAILSTSLAIVGGPGILVEADPDPDKDRPKVSVDLAGEKPGLEFTDGTDDGQLRVKPDENKGIEVGDDGVAVKPDTQRGIDVAADGVRAKIAAAEDEGLKFTAAGNLAVKPNTAKGVDQDADGVRVKIAGDESGGLRFAAGGDLEVKPNTDKGIEVTADGVEVKPNTDKGIDVGADGVETTVESDGGIEHGAGGGLQVKLAPTGSGGSGLELSGDGLMVAAGRGLNIEDNSVHVELADDPGLEFDGAGEDARLRAKPNTAKGLDRTADGLEVRLQTDGLEFDGDGQVRHKKKSSVRTLHFANGTSGAVFGWTDSDNVFHGWYSAMDVPLDTEDEGHVASASAGS